MRVETELKMRSPASHPVLLPGLHLWSQEIGPKAEGIFKEEFNSIWNSTCGSFESIKGLGLERPVFSFATQCVGHGPVLPGSLLEIQTLRLCLAPTNQDLLHDNNSR